MMQEYLAENARLRQLSKRYAAGELDLDAFREARRAILVALESGITEAQAEEAEPLALAGGSDTLPGTEPGEHEDITLFTPRLGSVVEPVPVHDEPEAGEPVPGPVAATAHSAPMDRHSVILLALLLAALVVALGMLGYVLLL